MANLSNGNAHNKVTPLGLASSPELRLWRAVLAAAAADAVDDSTWACDGNFRSSAVISRDIDYFLKPNRSFYQVCDLAGLNAEYVQRKIKKAIERKHVKNDLPKV